MAAAAISEIQVNAINRAIANRFCCKFGTQTKKNMLSLKITIPEVYGQVSRWPPPPFVN
jgi:hypothetical protein